MRIIFLFILGLMVVTSCKEDAAPDPGQLDYYPFPKKNAFWTISRCENSFNTRSGLVKIGIFGDTTINGHRYHKLYGQSKQMEGSGCSTCDFELKIDDAHYFLAFREEEKRIYVVPRNPVQGEPAGKEYVMFDFNIEAVGDEVTVYPFVFNPLTSNTAYWGGGIDQNETLTLKVKEISTLKMPDGTHRKVYRFDGFLEEAWIEGIGSSNGFAVFNYLFDIRDVTWGFSSSKTHVFDLPLLLDASRGCNMEPFTYAENW